MERNEAYRPNGTLPMTAPLDKPPVAGLVERLRELLAKATRGDWQVIVEKHPHYLGGEHTERRIFTTWNDPQLKGPWGVVNSSIGIAVEREQPVRHMVSISAEDAALICEMRNALSDLLSALEALSRRAEAAEALAERLKMEAQIHAGEARTANATIAEIYQLCTGATGEPGNWHGAEPVREMIAASRGTGK